MCPTHLRTVHAPLNHLNPPPPCARSTPWAVEQAAAAPPTLAGMFSRMVPRGGKMDDVTAVVAVVVGAAGAAAGRS